MMVTEHEGEQKVYKHEVYEAGLFGLQVIEQEDKGQGDFLWNDEMPGQL